MVVSTLEMSVLRKLVGGDLPGFAELRRQLESADVVSREMTGAGFYTRFALPSDAVPAPLRSGVVRFGDVEARVPGLAHGAGFLVYIEDGKLQMLEGYTYDEPWPDVIESFELRYSDPGRSSVARALAGSK
jgi:hypothetical protein